MFINKQVVKREEGWGTMDKAVINKQVVKREDNDHTQCPLILHMACLP